MFKDKQIEEMYKDVYEAINHNAVIDITHGGYIGINTDGLTKELYDDGYRKASDVAREIFEEIEKAFEPTISALFCISETLVDVSKSHISDEDAIKKIRTYLSGTISSKYRLNKMLAEIRKKYTEGEG